jgi:hypothetical protein
VLDDLILLQNLIEHLQRTPAIHHEIFRDDLEPCAGRFLRENVPIVRHAQPESDAVVRVSVERIRSHKNSETVGAAFRRDFQSSKKQPRPKTRLASL